MPDINKEFEKKLAKLIRAYQLRIRAIYDAAITDISIISNLEKYKGVTFNFDTAPAIKKGVNDLIANMHKDVQYAITNSIQQSWELSNEKNDKIADDLVGDRELTQKAIDLIYNPNTGALRSFIARQEKGINLSDRVWNLIEPYKFELEAGLADAINKGESAAKTATKLKRYLNEPDKLFRRVRNENGNLQLSKAAKAYHPGQGVYRSSYKNALRLTATENNIAYRTADFERWNKQSFTKGIEIKLSKSHPLFDICDTLAGTYPKDFKFTGWHPRCLCYAVPVLVSDDEFEKMEDVTLGLSEDAPDIKYVDKVPDAFNKYVKDNKKRIAGWKSKPYWVTDNKKYYATIR